MSQAVTHVDAGAAWSGVGDAQTLLDLFVPSCRRDTAPAMIFEDGVEVSRADLLALTEQFAGYLRERVDPGEVVAIMVANRAEYMIAHLAVCAVRATLVSINPTAKAHDTRHILTDSGAVLAIVDEDNRELMDGLRGDAPGLRDVVVVAGEEPAGLECLHREARVRSTSPRRTAAPTTSRTSTTPRAPPALREGLHARPQLVAALRGHRAAAESRSSPVTGCCRACPSTTPTRR